MNKSVLPALSVALGVPLCHNAKNESSLAAASSVVVTSSTTSSEENKESAASNSSLSDNNESAYAQRARNNVARIYARRMMDRCQLERQHPWAAAAAESTSSTSAAAPEDMSYYDGKQSTNMLDEAQSKLLSETLLSLIQMKEQLNKVKSISNGYIESTSGKNHQLLHQLGIATTYDDNTNNCRLYGNYATAVAACENSDATFRDRYNAIDTSKTATSMKESKPAEWGDDTIDLAERRLQFGKEISPLSNTTRLQRWGMAAKRMFTLGALVAPLGVMVPANIVLGSLAGRPAETEGDAAADGAVIEKKKKLPILQRYHHKLTQSTWDYALWAVESAGPTYIKLVQWASTRNDLFSPDFVGHFSKLQDETRGHTWRETEQCLERAYGKDWKKVLSFDRVIEDDDDESDGAEGGRLKRTGGAANRERQKRLERQETKKSTKNHNDKHPIGSGCVAQVYKARLCSSHGLHQAGTSVAVKVQHPRILEKVCLDFYLLNKAASFLEYIPYLNLDYLSMKDSVDQFRDIMLPQLDLRVEAHNLQRFRRDFEGEKQISFPEPLIELTSREVLVEKFVEGEPMLNYVLKEDETHSKKDREELARIGLETVMKMIFLHDFVHADLVSNCLAETIDRFLFANQLTSLDLSQQHPGNMIVDRNKSVRGSPLRIHMIDCGLTVELGERDHMNLVKILGSLIKRDGHKAGQLMVDTAKKCHATELDVELFCRGIQKICDDDEENNFLESVGDYITDICYMACKHKVKLEAAFINAALACEIMEGLASSLYPTMAVQQVALPMVVKAEVMHNLHDAYKGMKFPKFW